jgi:hypothetical protein
MWRAKAGHGCPDPLFQQLEPAPRHLVGIVLIKARHHLFFEQTIKRFSISRVHNGWVIACHAAIDQPPVGARIAFDLPPVTGAQMQRPIDRGFHPAGPARFEWLARRIQPDIAALHQKVRDVKIVVLYEGNTTADRRINGAIVYVLQVLFAGMICRMGFSSEDDLHGSSERRQDVH